MLYICWLLFKPVPVTCRSSLVPWTHRQLGLAAPRTGAVRLPVEQFRDLCCMGLDGDTGQVFLSFSFEVEVTRAHFGSLCGVRSVSAAFGA